MVEVAETGLVGIDFVEALHDCHFADGLELLVDEMAMELAGLEQYPVDNAFDVGSGYAKLDVLAFQPQVRDLNLQLVDLRDPLLEHGQALWLEPNQLLLYLLV